MQRGEATMTNLNIPRPNPAVRALPALRRAMLAAGLILCAAGLAAAATLNGTVKNGTTNRPVAHAQVVLLQLQGGMIPVGHTQTDAQGHFQFTLAELGSTPMLVKASYRGVSYYDSLPAGKTTSTVLVYDSTQDRKALSISSHTIVVSPKGSDLQVEEQYIVDNQTKPPLTFAAGRTFTFELPKGASNDQVYTSGSSNMPTRQKAITLPGQSRAIDWAFRPGKNIVQISYDLPYSSGQAMVATRSPYAAAKVFLAAPPGVQISTQGFDPVGSEQGYDVYIRQSVPAGTELAFAVSGVPSGGGSASSSQSASNNSSGDAAVATLPSRLHNFTWIFVIGIGGLLLLGTAILWRRSAAQPAASAAGPAAGAANGSRGNTRNPSADAATQEVEQKLNSIKDKLFQLELRHQAGTLSDEEYASQRQQVEETLQALLKN